MSVLKKKINKYIDIHVLFLLPLLSQLFHRHGCSYNKWSQDVSRSWFLISCKALSSSSPPKNHSPQCKMHQGQRNVTSTKINKSLFLLSCLFQETKILHYLVYSLFGLPRDLPSCQSRYNTSATLHSGDTEWGKLFNILSAALDVRHSSIFSLFITPFHLLLRSFYRYSDWKSRTAKSLSAITEGIKLTKHDYLLVLKITLNEIRTSTWNLKNSTVKDTNRPTPKWLFV